MLMIYPARVKIEEMLLISLPLLKGPDYWPTLEEG